MAIKTVKLGLAERHMIGELLQAQQRGDLDWARTVRTLRRDLALRDAAKTVKQLTEEAKEDKQPVPGWDDLSDLDQSHEYTVEGDALAALRDVIQKHDWSVHLIQQPDGSLKEIRLPVHPSVLEVVTNLAEAIAEAMDR